MNALLIDDDPLVHEILGAVLRAAFDDCEIRRAVSLSSALSTANAGRTVDLAIVDLGLPDCAPWEAVDRVRAQYPKAAVVVISADDARETIDAALKRGVAGYIPKSLNARGMVHALRLVASGGVYVPYE